VNTLGNVRTAQPRVSMVMLAFNQERFIRDAIQGALSQDYPNLEVVISDDGSSDATYQIMQEIASEYSGPHRIVINRTEENRGILPHFYEAVALASGELIVGAAGDDISYPQRVSRLAAAWRDGGADALFSKYDVVDENGKLIESGPPFTEAEYSPAAYFPSGRVRQIPGVTSAYSRAVFDAIPLPPERLMAEDYFFALMLGLRSRKIEFVDEVLVAYRQHSQSQGNAGGAEIDLETYELVVQKNSQAAAQILQYFEKVVVTGVGVDPRWGSRAEVDLARLRSDIAFFEFRARWLTSSFAERVRAAFRVRSSAQLVWLLPRLPGFKFLYWAKRLRKAVRRRRASS
jgi:glycosyltransferase involved in cell wall biosynthesis